MEVFQKKSGTLNLNFLALWRQCWPRWRGGRRTELCQFSRSYSTLSSQTACYTLKFIMYWSVLCSSSQGRPCHLSKGLYRFKTDKGNHSIQLQTKWYKWMDILQLDIDVSFQDEKEMEQILLVIIGRTVFFLIIIYKWNMSSWKIPFVFIFLNPPGNS